MDKNQLTNDYISLYNKVISEHIEVFKKQDLDMLNEFIEKISKAKRIFTLGVGREGIATRAFSMRLMHLGKEVHWLWDDTTPGMDENDLVIITNGSSNISHLNTVFANAKETGAFCYLVTGSRLGAANKIADKVLFVPAAVYKGNDDVVPSEQPMGNLFEQHLFMLFDIVIMLLEKYSNVSHEEMSKRHRNIE